MLNRNRWKEALLSLAAGHAMIPMGDNGAVIRGLAAEVWALRRAEAATRAGSAQRIGARTNGRGGALTAPPQAPRRTA